LFLSCSAVAWLLLVGRVVGVGDGAVWAMAGAARAARRQREAMVFMGRSF
jgi:hypothetical protein